MNSAQIQTLIRTLLKIIGTLFIAKGATNVGGALMTETIIELTVGLVTSGIGIWMSHKKAGEIPVVAISTGIVKPDGSTDFIVRPANAVITKSDPVPSKIVEVQPTSVVNSETPKI